MGRHGRAWQGVARQGVARLGAARHGLARLGKARQGHRRHRKRPRTGTWIRGRRAETPDPVQEVTTLDQSYAQPPTRKRPHRTLPMVHRPRTNHLVRHPKRQIHAHRTPPQPRRQRRNPHRTPPTPRHRPLRTTRHVRPLDPLHAPPRHLHPRPTTQERHDMTNDSVARGRSDRPTDARLRHN